MKNKLLFILTNPFFLSFFLTIILLIALPPIFPKYKIELIKKDKNTPTSPIEFCDLNNDGFSEQITIIKGYKNRTGIIVRDKGTIIEQWNFKGAFNMKNLFYGDFNNDGLKEIFLFTIFNNKILLNCFNPFQNKNYIVDKYIDNFIPRNSEGNSGNKYCNLFKVNNSNTKNFIFAFSPGYSIFPRRVYYYDFEKDTIYKSPQSCSSLARITFAKDPLNNTPFFIATTAAVGNCDLTVDYTDYFTWLMVFDKDLKFKFEPIKIGVYPSHLSVLPLKIDNKIFLVALNIYLGNNNYPNSISLYNLNGKMIRTKEFQYFDERGNLKLFENKGKIFLLTNSGYIEEIYKDLSLNKKQKILENIPSTFTQIDVDLDNEKEFLSYHRSQEKITILRNNFSNPIIVDVPGNNGLDYSSVILNGASLPQLFLRLEKYSYYFNYYKNQVYNYKYLFYGLIYLGMFFLLFLLQKVQKYRLEQKYNIEKKIAELQIKSIKNQTDPHFTLNIINSIGSLFAKQETEKANYVFGKYSKLLRSTILSSDQILTTLDNEITYVKNYLALEQFRFINGFDFEIKKEENINGEIKIPKMLIHTFVENAIKHGIKHLESKGNLEVSITNSNSLYKIRISDNGIGRIKAKEIHTFGTGKGLEIMNQILDLYYTLEKVRITYKIIDLLSEEHKPLGTEVLIKIPILKSK